MRDQKDRWQQAQWTAAPDDSLDFSAVVVKFKSLVGGEHLVVCGALLDGNLISSCCSSGAAQLKRDVKMPSSLADVRELAQTRLQQCVHRTKHRAIGSSILVDNAGTEATVASRRDGAGAAAVVGIEAPSSGVDGRRKGGR